MNCGTGLYRYCSASQSQAMTSAQQPESASYFRERKDKSREQLTVIYYNSPHHPITVPPLTMQAIRLQKKYPDVSQDEMFDLMNSFKCVSAFAVGFRSR
jgi:hypothetical protein